MSLSETIKEEICHNTFSKNESKILLTGFVRENKIESFKNGVHSWILTSYFQSVIILINNLFTSNFTIEKALSYTVNKNQLLNKRKFMFIIKSDDFETIENQLKLNNNEISFLNLENAQYYLDGAFLTCGNISETKTKSYQLEFSSYNSKYIRNIQKILSWYDISITIGLRKQEHILYVKRENDILNFIKIIGAYTVYDELKKRKSAQKIVVTNMRLNNLEVSNIYKTAKASSVQIPIITEIIGTEEFEKSPEKFKIFCNMRIENPNSSYSDLVKNFKEEHNITITRAGLNHFMVKAKNIYDKIKKN